MTEISGSDEFPPVPSFLENPDEELQTFVSISKNNLEKYKADVKVIKEGLLRRSDPCMQIQKLQDQYNAVLKENDKLSVETVVVEGELKYHKRKIKLGMDDIDDIKNLIEECVVVSKELEKDMSYSQEKLRNKHNALKQATSYYKSCLDIYVHVEPKNDLFRVKVCLFTRKLDDTYSFILVKKENDKWDLDSTNPKLVDSQFMMLKKRFCDTNNFCALFSTIRKIFKLYNLNN